MHARIYSAALAAIVLLPGLATSQGNPVADAFRDNAKSSAKNLVAAAEEFPADKYGYKPDDFPVAYQEYQRIVSLPLYPRMTDRDAADVIDAVRDVVRTFRR